MKRPYLNMTESDVKDVFEIMDGHVGSWNFNETIGHPLNMKNFEDVSVDDIKEYMRLGVQKYVSNSSFERDEYIYDGFNVYFEDGTSVKDTVFDIEGISIKENLELSLSKKGIGFTGPFDVRMSNGEIKSMNLIIAPYFYVDEDVLSEIEESHAIPDHVKDILDALTKDPMGIDWDDLTPHQPCFTYDISKNDIQGSLDTSLMREVENDIPKQNEGNGGLG